MIFRRAVKIHHRDGARPNRQDGIAAKERKERKNDRGGRKQKRTVDARLFAQIMTGEKSFSVITFLNF
jgi:hypothetical protein